MKWYLWGAVVLLYSLFGSACSTERRYDLSAYGLSPVENVDNAPAMARALEQDTGEMRGKSRQLW